MFFPKSNSMSSSFIGYFLKKYLQNWRVHKKISSKSNHEWPRGFNILSLRHRRLSLKWEFLGKHKNSLCRQILTSESLPEQYDNFKTKFLSHFFLVWNSAIIVRPVSIARLREINKNLTFCPFPVIL